MSSSLVVPSHPQRQDGNLVAGGRCRRHRRVQISPSADGYPLTTESLPSTLESGAETPIVKRQNLAAAIPAARFSSANMEALKSGKYADAKVIANGKTYNVHKVVVCTRSKWFRAAFDGGFTVSTPMAPSCHISIIDLANFFYKGGPE